LFTTLSLFLKHRDDVLRSIKTLAPLGSGFQVFEIGNKKMVSSVPRELNKDQSIILGLVQVKLPFYSRPNQIKERSISPVRLQLLTLLSYVSSF